MATACMVDAIENSKQHHEDKPVALVLVFSCTSRRKMLGDKAAETVRNINESYGFPVAGFYSFTEIGSKLDRQAQANNQTVTNLVIYDRLLTE